MCLTPNERSHSHTHIHKGVAVCNGTVAISLALLAGGLQRGDEVPFYQGLKVSYASFISAWGFIRAWGVASLDLFHQGLGGSYARPGGMQSQKQTPMRVTLIFCRNPGLTSAIF